MDEAKFVFHALFPDPSPSDVEAGKGACIIVFDIEYDDRVYSHLTAQITPDEGSLEIVHDLPVPCPDFPKAAQTYFQLMMDSHGENLSPSGPKGMLPNNNVFRAEWAISLKVAAKH